MRPMEARIIQMIARSTKPELGQVKSIQELSVMAVVHRDPGGGHVLYQP